MATVTWTITANSNAGAQLRRLATQIENMASALPDNASTGASTVVTFDNGPSSGSFSVQVTAGPYQTSAYLI